MIKERNTGLYSLVTLTVQVYLNADFGLFCFSLGRGGSFHHAKISWFHAFGADGFVQYIRLASQALFLFQLPLPPVVFTFELPLSIYAITVTIDRIPVVHASIPRGGLHREFTLAMLSPTCSRRAPGHDSAGAIITTL